MSKHSDEGRPGDERGRSAGDDGDSRPEEILADRSDEDGISDEEAVLAYNENAEQRDGEAREARESRAE